MSPRGHDCSYRYLKVEDSKALVVKLSKVSFHQSWFVGELTDLRISTVFGATTGKVGECDSCQVYLQ